LNAGRKLPGAQGREFAAGMPEAVVAAVERGSALGWLPLETHMAVLARCRQLLGALGYRDFFRGRMAASLDNPLLFAKPVAAAFQFFGAQPLSILRIIPVCIPYVFRDVGRVTVDLGAELSATIVHEGFPPRFSEGDLWSLGWLGTFEALVDHATADLPRKADVTLRSQDPRRGYFEWSVAVREIRRDVRA
jgi:hypothetical protein